MGVQTLLRCPPPGNPINYTASFLQPRGFQAWADHWFGSAKRRGQTRGVADHSPDRWPFRSPLTSSSSSVPLAWTYDPEVSSGRLSAA